MTTTVDLRLVRVSDAAEVSSFARRNRAFLEPFEPARADEYYSESGQRLRLASLLRQHEAGSMVPFVITRDDALVGFLNINNIVRGSFESGSLGYSVDADAGGLGIATAAVAIATRHAFDVLGLHRLEAGTLVTNLRSQRVLEKNGFERYGLAPKYLRIADAWQDHVLFQRLTDA